jgi:hypothetical protein
MTIGYATLASPTLRTAYDDAMGMMRRQLTPAPVGKPIIPDKVTWLNSEMLKIRVARGYCSRHEAASRVLTRPSRRADDPCQDSPVSFMTNKPLRRDNWRGRDPWVRSVGRWDTGAVWPKY